MISRRTFGTSEKNCSANMPATAPNEAAVIPLLPVRSQSNLLNNRSYVFPGAVLLIDWDRDSFLQFQGPSSADAVEISAYPVAVAGADMSAGLS